MRGSGIPRVMLVDDSVEEVEFASRAVERSRPEVELVVFRRGRDAVEYLQGAKESGGAPVGLVLLDLKLPGMGGLEILGEIRTMYALGELPVVVLTSSKEPGDVAHAYAGGANSYLVKPVGFEDFRDVVTLATEYWLDLNLTADGH